MDGIECRLYRRERSSTNCTAVDHVSLAMQSTTHSRYEQWRDRSYIIQGFRTFICYVELVYIYLSTVTFQIHLLWVKGTKSYWSEWGNLGEFIKDLSSLLVLSIYTNCWSRNDWWLIEAVILLELGLWYRNCDWLMDCLKNRTGRAE